MDDPLEPAARLATLRRPRIVGESVEYAQTREVLLAEEIEVCRHLGRLALQVSALPQGPVVTGDFRFLDSENSEVALDDLFGRQDTLVVYH